MPRGIYKRSTKKQPKDKMETVEKAEKAAVRRAMKKHNSDTIGVPMLLKRANAKLEAIKIILEL